VAGIGHLASPEPHRFRQAEALMPWTGTPLCCTGTFRHETICVPAAQARKWGDVADSRQVQTTNWQKALPPATCS